MSENEIIEKLKEIFKLVIDNTVDTDQISLDSNIANDLCIDSVGLIYMSVAIEKEFNIDMGEATFNSFKTIRDVIKFIEERI